MEPADMFIQLHNIDKLPWHTKSKKCVRTVACWDEYRFASKLGTPLFRMLDGVRGWLWIMKQSVRNGNKQEKNGPMSSLHANRWKRAVSKDSHRTCARPHMTRVGAIYAAHRSNIDLWSPECGYFCLIWPTFVYLYPRLLLRLCHRLDSHLTWPFRSIGIENVSFRLGRSCNFQYFQLFAKYEHCIQKADSSIGYCG